MVHEGQDDVDQVMDEENEDEEPEHESSEVEVPVVKIADA